MKIRFIFALLISFLFLSLHFSNIKLAIFCSSIKALILAYYFMELEHANKYWKMGFLGLLGLSGLTLYAIA